MRSSEPSVHVPLYAIRHTAIGGTEFAIYNLVHGLVQAGADVSVSYGRDGDLSPGFLQWLRSGQSPNLHAYRKGGMPGPKNSRFFEELAFALRSTGDDWVVFPNYFCPPRLPNARRRRCVILHDIQYKVYPGYHSPKRRAWLDFYLPLMFKHADKVILISHSELELVREHFGPAAAARCEVVYNAIDWERFGRDAPEDTLPEEVRERLGQRYILSVCHLFPHKNVATVLKAFGQLAGRDPDLRIYLVGAMSPANAALIRASLPAELVERVHLLGFVDDRSLGAYYAHAELFVLPSLYEGFGMPAIEALGLGIPTLVSRRYALPEVTMGHASYVDDPLDAGEWSARMSAILADPLLPAPEIVERVRARYAPAAIGRALLDVLRN